LHTENGMTMNTTKEPTKFILALRKYRERKHQWEEKMEVKLAAIEERLKKMKSICITTSSK